MLIDGQPSMSRPTLVVQLPRVDASGPRLLLSPLPLGFARRLRDHQLTPPVPPVRVARDADGRPLRQANGQGVLVPDPHDTDYERERETYHHRVAVLSIVEALRNDSAVVFETSRESFGGDWRAYADAVYAELEAAHWTAGDLVWLCEQIARLSNLLEDHLRQATADFSSGRPEAGLSPNGSTNPAR